jgi:hypothetical protein
MALRAGPLEMVFDPKTAFLRCIHFENLEVVRGIYAAVRDRNWGTIAPDVTLVSKEIGAGSFHLRFDVSCRQGEIDFVWHGHLLGGNDGSVRFHFEGEARSAFLSNRVGFCVLHPIAECAGKPCRIETTDGRMESGQFPLYILPQQPFKKVRAISHEIMPGCMAEVRMEGDLFETEDQRNWTDASYKTYCTPLERPFPVEIRKGTKIKQTVTVQLRGRPQSRPIEVSEGAVEVQIDRARVRPKPCIGLGMPSHGRTTSDHQRKLLKQLALTHLRVELRLGSSEWRTRLDWACAEAAAMGTGLEAALFPADDIESELKALLAEVDRCGAPIRLWTVCATPSISDKNTEIVRSMLQGAGRTIPIAAGTDANFAEWNRNRPLQGSDALPCFSITPQIHAFDRVSMVENIQAQAMAVESAWHWTLKPVVASPITLRPRFNAVATGATTVGPEPNTLPPEADLRQLSLFCAGWTLGSLAALCGTGHCHSATYYETTGWRGIMETEQGSPLPAAFPSIPGAVFPVYHVFASLAGYSHMAPLTIGNQRELAGMALFQDDQLRRLIIANLGPESVEAIILLEASSARLSVLDSTSATQAMIAPEDWGSQTIQIISGNRLKLHLPPFAFARIDL